MNIRKLRDWKTVLIYLHRWMGIVLGLVFVVWLASGIAMRYVGMPRLSASERLGHMKPLNLSTARVEPADAAKANGLSGRQLRVEMFYDGRPIYRFDGGAKVYADPGEAVPGASAELRSVRPSAARHSESTRSHSHDCAALHQFD